MAVLDLPYCVHCGEMVRLLQIEANLLRFHCDCGETVEVDHGGEGLLPDSGSR